MKLHSRKAKKRHTCMSCGKDIKRETRYIIAYMSWQRSMYLGKFHNKKCWKKYKDRQEKKIKR